MSAHRVVSRASWDEERAVLLVHEKEHTRVGDELARRRRELPWVQIEKDYTLQTAEGDVPLAQLFAGRSQLAVYHFMFGPTYEAGCPVNSSMADGFDGLIPHLNARDVTMICVSGAPIAKLLTYRERMGWNFEWASSSESDFNRDMGFSSPLDEVRQWLESGDATLPPVAARNAAACGTDLAGYLSEGFGFTAYVMSGDVVYQTYSATRRGVEFLMGYYPILDHTPIGRDEDDGFQLWIHRRDEYEVYGTKPRGS